MRLSRIVLATIILLLWPGCLASQCIQQGGAYEGFHVTSVSIQTPLRFPIPWIEKLLLGNAIKALELEAADLPLKANGVFHFHDHMATLEAIQYRYSIMRPGERIRIALVKPDFTECDANKRTVEVVYRVYSTDSSYFVSRLLDAQRLLPDRSMTVGKAAETKSKILAVPFAGYDRSLQLFGGMKATWSGGGSLVNSAELEAGGSISGYKAGFLVGGSHDPESGLFSHIEWKSGFRSSNDPAGGLKFQKSVVTAQAFAATRAYGALGTMLRFGAAIEAGSLDAETNRNDLLSDAPQRVLKAFLGGTWSHNRHLWKASYGFQLGKGTDRTMVDYTKHIVDMAHQVRLLPREHWPIQVDSHFNAGWILGLQPVIPVAERFFGGNMPRDFLENSLWGFPADPQLRSFPHNRLNIAGPGQAIGGTSFVAFNITAAFPVWTYPAMPAMIRHVKPLEDGIHLGVQSAQRTSLEDFRARTSLFADALKEALAIKPELESLRDQLSRLAKLELPEELSVALNDLLDTHISPALEDLGKAQKVPRNGLAWSVCRKISRNDPDLSLAHIIDDLDKTVAPGLDSAGLTTDADLLRAIAKILDFHKQKVAALLAPIESFAVVPQSSLDDFREDLADLRERARSLRDAAKPFVGKESPLGTLAFDVVERSNAVGNTADPGPDPDPFDSLYDLNRLAAGIGELVPPLIESAAEQAYRLAAAILGNHPADGERIRQLADDLRLSLTRIRSKLEAISIPPGDRWARNQNHYFIRAMDVAFREMNLAAISPAVAFDAARIGPQSAGFPAMRYGIGPAVRFSIVSFHVTLGYSFNPHPLGAEKRGAFFFTMEATDLFR